MKSSITGSVGQRLNIGSRRILLPSRDTRYSFYYLLSGAKILVGPVYKRRQTRMRSPIRFRKVWSYQAQWPEKAGAITNNSLTCPRPRFFFHSKHFLVGSRPGIRQNCSRKSNWPPASPPLPLQINVDAAHAKFCPREEKRNCEGWIVDRVAPSRIETNFSAYVFK